MQTGIPIKFNLSKSPRITLVKQVSILIDFPNVPIQDRYYFNYDAEINNSIITGIKVNEKYLNAVGNFSSYLNTPNGQIINSDYDVFVNASFLLTIKNKFDNTLVENYPLYTLCMKNDLSNSQRDYTGVRRFNLEADLSKSYVSIADKNNFELATWIPFDIYYQPKN